MYVIRIQTDFSVGSDCVMTFRKRYRCIKMLHFLLTSQSVRLVWAKRGSRVLVFFFSIEPYCDALATVVLFHSLFIVLSNTLL